MRSIERATKFWKKYTDRNVRTVSELDALYTGIYGVTRTEMDIEFIAGLDRNINILEVGCGVGLQLEFLKGMGFRYLFGIERLDYASKIASGNGFDIFTGDASNLCFNDNTFDLVFTSGLLIHIPPEELPEVMSEIHRCSKRWIWGLEYYEDKLTPIEYREDICWKADYVSIFREHFPDLSLIKEVRYPRQRGNVDTMFLMEKGGKHGNNSS